MKKRILKFSLYSSILIVTIFLGLLIINISEEKNVYKEDGINSVAKIDGKDFYIYKNEKWEKKFLKGVNIGAAKPGSFPGELKISKSEYLRWFKQISDMNAEVIRVYTTLDPVFYDALYEYNKSVENPLYLMQGVWVKEEDIEELKDAYGDNEKIKKEFIKDALDLVDIFHGNAILPEKAGFASGVYTRDISKYVIGWILGIEWDPEFVDITNNNNTEKNSFSGKYLETKDAPAFETFLCEVGDKVLDYEINKYKASRPLSFTNWLTTDMLDHPNEPLPKEDMASVNMEYIKTKEAFKQGLFASYHVYPYYPDFINYQKEYRTFKDDTGKINTYKAYLRDLIKEHKMPVLVAEFGIPASRGMAHLDIHSGYNQGNHDETEQGNIVAKLLSDIYDEGYCGGLVFSWQDEWFKRTWNTMDFDLPDHRPFWSNPQTNEQQFGLLAFDPGKDESICYVDGDVDEWKKDKPLYSNSNLDLFVKSDEKYVYLMLDTKDFDFTKEKLVIPIDTIDKQGNNSVYDGTLKFSRDADFIIVVDGKDNTKILVDSYYDSFYYMYAEQLKMIDKVPKYSIKHNGIFKPMNLCLSREFALPEDNVVMPFSQYETGKLKYGIANPKDKNFNSLSDFYEKDGKIEIKIPWQLLNVMDPSSKQIMGDFYKNNDIKPQKTDGFYFGAAIAGREIKNIDMKYYSWQPWEEPTFHERLKPSYYILQEAFKNYK